METVLIMLTVQALLGAFDNFWHHELTERLPSKVSARTELALHTAREFLYAAIFLAIGWAAWHGAWAWALAAVFAVEIVITLTDFIVEDQTRKLPKFERVLHTILAINFGAILAFLLPEIYAWSQVPAAVVPADYGPLSWIMTVFAAGVFVWAVRDAIAVVALTIRTVPEWQRKPFRAGKSDNPRHVLVTGGTGFIGGHLCRALAGSGDTVTVLTRDRAKAQDRFGPHVRIVEDLNEIPDTAAIDAVVNLAGAPVAAWPWTAARRKVLVKSRMDVTRAVLELIARLRTKPEVLVSGSAIGFYGARGDDWLVEDDGPRDEFMSELCREWEALAEDAGRHGVRVVTLRTGLVLGPDGGVWPQLALPARFGVGAVLGSGRQWVSWIHIADLIRMIVTLLSDLEIRGPVNATAPHPVMQRQFVKTMGRAFRRPVWLWVPKWALTVPLGELADLFVEGQHVRPAKILKRGFRFAYQDIGAAIADLAGTAPAQSLPTKPRPANENGEIYAHYNRNCPVCRAEIDMYAKKAARAAAPIRFFNVIERPHDLEPYGIGPEDAKKRMYTLDRDGNIHAGIDAVLAIWDALPGYGLQRRLVRMPGVYHLAAALYDGVIAPTLFAWGERRAKRRHAALGARRHA